MSLLYLKLVDGRRVRNPDSGEYLKPGKVYKLKRKQFWFRRLKDGDVVEAIEKSNESVYPARKKPRGVK